MRLTLFISPQGRLLDMLNDGRGFLPAETETGQVMFLRKDAIRRVSERRPALSGATADAG